MRYLAMVAVLCCATTARAGLVTVSFGFTGTVTSFGEDTFVFPGGSSPFPPITDIHAGDTFTGTGSFTFDPNQVPLGTHWSGDYESVITVGSHHFATAGKAAGGSNELTASNHEYGFFYATDRIDPDNHLISELDVVGAGVYAPNAPILTMITADLAAFQSGRIDYDFEASSPGVFRYGYGLMGTVTSLDLATAPEPGMFGAAAVGLLAGGVLCWRRRIAA